METQKTGSNLSTVRQFVEKHKAFSEHQVRWIIFNREKNGFSHCFIKLGAKRILVDEAAFFEQVERGRMGVAA